METVKSMALDMEKSFVEQSYIIESLAEKMAFSLEYADIYTDIWCNQQSPFIKEPVLRDGPQDHIEVTVPETTWAFGDSPAILGEILGRLGVRPFIRREYEVALYDIMEAKKTGNPIIIVRDDCEEIHADLTQATIGAKRIPEDLVDDRAQKRQHTGKVSGEHVADPRYYTNNEPSLEQYANPFREEEAESQLSGFIILGHTGIGKAPHVLLGLDIDGRYYRKIHIPLLHPSVALTSEETDNLDLESQCRHRLPSTGRVFCGGSPF